MGSLNRAAITAAMTFAFSLGAASAPSFAETVHSAVSVISNEQQTVAVPAPVAEPVQQTGDIAAVPSAPEAAPAPAPKAASLAQLVAQQDFSAELDREAECLAASVYFESKGEPLEGQLAVAEVVINRAESGGRFPPSICKVVFQKGQFHFVRNGGFPPIAKSSHAWREAVAIARIAMDEAWESRASNAMFFHARRVSPGWNKVRVAQLGNHVFYR
jgi:spore germination cell wall hydrolase CwlJ-like protein